MIEINGIMEPMDYKRHFETWLQNGNIPDISMQNQVVIKEYVLDMYNGINVAPSSKKGRRSYSRLIAIKSKMKRLCMFLEQRYNLQNILDIHENLLLLLFNDLRDGKILTHDGRKYEGVDNSAKVFTSFWHWYMRRERKNGKIITDITLDLIKKADAKPDWVYLDEKQFSIFMNQAKWEYKVLLNFLFDSGLRTPKELINVRMRDLDWDSENKMYYLNINDESSKTFGRKIKLMLCSTILKMYIEQSKLSDTDIVFNVDQRRVNEYLQRLALRVFGDTVSKARAKYTQITMYDIRHCSACYWIPRYKSESALKYRFGWRKSEMINYYSEFLGMKDTIQVEDLIIDNAKSEIELELQKEKLKIALLQEQIHYQKIEMEDKMKQFEVMMLQKFADSF